ncbi:MAG: hypothetical protein C0467_02900 [Planctomycetaceae bacterium]|nr:hypothetical protein [Planctomycetaceae bacterium]
MADSSPHPRELDRLLARLVDGIATADEIAALEHILGSNAEARRRYVHYLDLHAELQQESSLSPQAAANASLSRDDSDSRDRIRSRRYRMVAVAAVAATLLIATGMLIGRQLNRVPRNNAVPELADNGNGAPTSKERTEPTDDSVAMLTQVIDAVWQMETPPLTGSSLLPGRLRLTTGTIQINFFSGAVVVLEGPADFELVSINRAICRQGRLRGIVPPQARGFTVVAPDTELVDLGTEFGMDIPAAGPTDIHVFNGEVELLPPVAGRAPNRVWKVTAGQTVRIDARGEPDAVAVDPKLFASLDRLKTAEQTHSQNRYQAWRKESTRLRDDPRLLAYYDFEPRTGDTRILHDHIANRTAADGTIIGCSWTSGRWPEKSALEFRRSGDRVRCTLPGQFDALTLTAWVRVDALSNNLQGLLLTDGYQVGRPHWQITGEGELRLGIRLPDINSSLKASGYGSPVVFDSRRLGVWTFVATVYDRRRQRVEHWIDGRLVAQHQLQFDQPLSIGLAEIGNWGVPLPPDRHPIRNLNGRIDEFSIWNVALEPTEIAKLFQAGRP